MRIVLFLILLASPLHAIGFANGVKIGEVTDTSAVIWTRLTAHDDASHRVDAWTDEKPWHWTAPGADGEVRLTIWQPGSKSRTQLEWVPVSASHDHCHQFPVGQLAPASTYAFKIEGRLAGAGTASAEFTGTFTTAPDASADAPVTFVVSTCQDFPRRDDLANGHRIYQSMLAPDPDFFVQTGDTLYYDKPKPLAQDIATARYKWNRLYSLPNLREFHRRVPSYWLHDDHDVLKNDCWPGQTFGEFTWKQGLQVWFPEGREFRSPNTMDDGPDKTIFGKEQWQWIQETMRASKATHKFFVSATPVVGPDRRGKKDNHANKSFAHEGERLRKFLASIPGCVVINGDRHWQYHSVDARTGLQEFGSGPASDKHAGGWSQKNKLEPHRFLRVKGGFLSVEANAHRAVLRHHDVDGKIVNEVTLNAR